VKCQILDLKKKKEKALRLVLKLSSCLVFTEPQVLSPALPPHQGTVTLSLKLSIQNVIFKNMPF
jgi:hypothetical protein